MMTIISNETISYRFFTVVTLIIMRCRLVKATYLSIELQHLNVEYKKLVLMDMELIDTQ
jgi:hypothetical protein